MSAASPEKSSRSTGERAAVAHVLAPAAYGGLERVVAALASATQARGRRVVVVLALEPGVAVPAWVGGLSERGVVVEAIVNSRRAYLAERRAIVAALGRHKARVVHLHGERPDVVVGPAAIAAGFRVLTTMHGFTRSGWRRWILDRIRLRAVRRFDAVVAVSRPLEATLRDAGISAERLHLIANGMVPAPETTLGRAEARHALGLPANGVVIGWVGRVSEEKGADVIVEAMSHLRSENARLCVIGDGAALAACRERAVALGVTGRIHFAGARADAARFFGAFDVLALSSRTEGTPMVVLEAAAATLPVVATSVGGVPDLLGDLAGWLVPPEDPGALARALDESLSDPSAARARATRLRERVAAGSTMNDWIVAYERLYDRLARSTEGGTVR